MQNLMKLQNGSDIRGIACEGVAGEEVNLTPEAGNLIGQALSLIHISEPTRLRRRRQ